MTKPMHLVAFLQIASLIAWGGAWGVAIAFFMH